MSVEVIEFGNVPDAVRDGNENAILELVTRVTSTAKNLAPVDTGQLKGSIMGKVKGAEYGHTGGPMISERPKEGEGYVGTAVLHGIYNEFGTRNLAAQPFLRPAVATEANGLKSSYIVKKLQIDAIRKGMAKGPRKKKVIP